MLNRQDRRGQKKRASKGARKGSPPRSTGNVTLDIAQKHESEGRLSDAAELYHALIKADPLDPEPVRALALLAYKAKYYNLASSLFRRALDLGGQSAEIHFNLALTHSGLGDYSAARVSLESALSARPDLAQAHLMLGNLHQWDGQLDLAERNFNAAIKIDPRYAHAFMNLGNLRREQRRSEEAETLLRRALFLKKDDAEIHRNLGGALQDQGELKGALDHFKRALEIDPGIPEGHSSLLLCLNYDNDVSMEDIYRQHVAYANRIEGLGICKTLHPRHVRLTERVKIGYVSGDFCRHPVGYFLASVLESHDRDKFESICYSNGSKNDDLTQRMRRASDGWEDIRNLSDSSASERIRDAGIDILVDLSGHTGRNRLGIFARRPAPVQASWIGYVATTGMTSIDYVLTDIDTVPLATEKYFSETVLRLPSGRFCYAPPDYAPDVASRATDSTAIVFGSFNHVLKIGPEVVKLWSELLRQTPNSRLLLKWLSLGDKSTRDRLKDRFVKEGVAAERIELRGPSPHRDMLAEYGDMDIALDPFPYCGGMTSCEALWMGVPVVTWPGERPSSRQTLPMLRALGLSDLAADSSEAYVRIAADLAHDRDRLASLRTGLRSHMASSSLCDAKSFTLALEQAYRTMISRLVADGS